MAVPQGHTIPRRVSEWIEEALAHPGTAILDARGWRTYRTFVRAIANAIDPKSMTTTFSWDSLGAAVAELEPRAGDSPSTVARQLHQLREWNLLGVVATGRTAKYAPKTNGGINERAVYVLSVVRRLEAVDKFDTPPLEEADVAPRTHAREDLGQPQAEPLRGQPSEAAQARPAQLPAQRQDSAWPRSVTPKRKDEMLSAAATLCHLLPALRPITPRHVRSVLRPYFLADWTLTDVQHAIDHRPSGTLWPHDGARGVTNHGAWLAHRLAAWTDAGGTVRRSPSQRIAAEQRELAARARARRQAEAAGRGAAAGPMSPGRRLARAVIEAIRTGQPPPIAAPPPDTRGNCGGLASSGTLTSMPKSRKRKRVADKQRAQRSRQHRSGDHADISSPPLGFTLEGEVDDAADEALRRRGWRQPFEDVPGHLWQWPPSCDPRDDAIALQVDDWQEGTTAFPARGGRFTVQLAHMPGEPDTWSPDLHYESLEELLAALDVIEKYRPGDPVPHPA